VRQNSLASSLNNGRPPIISTVKIGSPTLPFLNVGEPILAPQRKMSRKNSVTHEPAAPTPFILTTGFDFSPRDGKMDW
jgi:hypothetical protein